MFYPSAGCISGVKKVPPPPRCISLFVQHCRVKDAVDMSELTVCWAEVHTSLLLRAAHLSGASGFHCTPTKQTTPPKRVIAPGNDPPAYSGRTFFNIETQPLQPHTPSCHHTVIQRGYQQTTTAHAQCRPHGLGQISFKNSHFWPSIDP